MSPRVFLPVVLDGSFPTVTRSPREEFTRLWLNAPWQQRQKCREDKRLLSAAMWLCEDMYKRDRAGENGWNLHIDSLGRWSNKRVKDFGYSVNWDDDQNFCESICVTHEGPSVALQILYNSPWHRPHVAGEIEFYRSQIVYGVGYYPNAWYVLVTCPVLS